MPIAPVQSGATLAELMLRVGITFGVVVYADGSGKDAPPTLPDSPSRLAIIRQAVNDGYQEFLAANPVWSFMQPTVRLTLDPTGTGGIDGDPARYALPNGIASDPVDRWRIVSGSAAGYWIVSTHAGHVAKKLADDPTPAVPRLAGSRVTRRTDGSSAWEVLFWPKPAEAFVVEAEFRLQPARLENNDDRHVAGPQHDYAIQALAEAAFAKLDRRSDDRMMAIRANADRVLALAIRNDERMSPRTLGVLPPTTISPRSPLLGVRRVTNSDPYTVEIPS